MGNPLWSRVLGGALAAAMACAGYSAVRAAYADYLARTDSPVHVRKALSIVPDNANYWLHWVDLKEAAGEPGDLGIRRAAEADPYNAAVWIRAGIHAEMCGDYVHAEQYLLRAARQSRQFEPRWALADYYFRRHDEEHFWPWAKSALVWASGDRRLLFDLFWAMRPDPEMIRKRAIPNDPKIWREYLDFLLHNHRSEAAIAISHQLEPVISADDRDLFLRYTDHMLNEGRWQPALSAWNALCRRKLLPFAPLDPPGGEMLTGGSFASEPLNLGFDWRLSRVDGVVAVHSGAPAWLRFDFSGKQPENCNLLNQFVPVVPGGRYRLRFGYRTQGILPQTGLQWKVINATTLAELPASPGSLASDQWTDGDTTFVAPAGAGMVRLVLAYRRPAGTVRVEGSLWVRNVRLEAQR